MTPGGPGHLHTRLRPAPPPGPGPASRGGAPLAQPGAAGGGGLGGTCTGSAALRRAPHPPPGCWQPGDGLARPSPYPPGSFHGSAAILRPFLEQSPAAGTGPARREPRGGGGCGAEPRGPGAGAARRSQAPGARRGAPQSYPPGSCATSAGPARHPRARPHSRSVPHRARRRGPRAQRSPRPGRLARGRGAAQAKLLSCLARSEVAAETAASRPLPGLGGSEHTPTRHHPLPALAPAAPARTRQHPLPAPARSPGFQRSRAGGGRTPPPRSSGGWGGREEGG